ncbi:MAG TPA: sigma-70 family RNA polymerase sigma factor, partial [Solirubrobacteraceae bacterium]|nr:sigma-70 family RNA polymerase sigma factor [Solirubrobacteraceae bacterium]
MPTRDAPGAHEEFAAVEQLSPRSAVSGGGEKMVTTLPNSDSALFARAHAGADRRARNALVERHLPLAHSIARRYAYTPQPLEDLVQIASLALVKAVDGFDPERGTSFTAFAVPTIVGELRRSMRVSAWALHMPRRLQEGVLAVQRAERAIAARGGHAPTVDALAREAGISSEAVLEAYAARLARDAVPLERAPAGAQNDPAIEAVAERAAVAGELERLPAREREVLRLRFGEDLTQSQIAARLGIS